MAGAPRPAWFPARLFPYEGRFVELEGCTVHYVDEGEAAESRPVLLMLHGNPTWSFLYRGLIERLRGRFRCVAPDYPGFGLSWAPPGYDFRPAAHARVVSALVERLGLRAIIPVVHDWGGPIGLGVAARTPARVAGLVIANSWAWPVNGDWHFEWFSRALGGRLGRLLIQRLNVFVNVLVPLGVRTHRPPPEVMAAYRGPFPDPARRLPTHVFPREILASREYLRRVEADIARLAHLPALIVWGGRDPAFRARERRRFESLFPRHRTVILERAGHFVPEDAPAEMAAAIWDWWHDAGG